MLGKWWQRMFGHREVEVPSELQDALTERDELIGQTNRVLDRFRKAHDALSDRRRKNIGHDPERRGI